MLLALEDVAKISTPRPVTVTVAEWNAAVISSTHDCPMLATAM
jgi:hypothetical protein